MCPSASPPRGICLDGTSLAQLYHFPPPRARGDFFNLKRATSLIAICVGEEVDKRPETRDENGDNQTLRRGETRDSETLAAAGERGPPDVARAPSPL